MAGLQSLPTMNQSTTENQSMKSFALQLIEAAFFAMCVFVPFFLWSM